MSVVWLLLATDAELKQQALGNSREEEEDFQCLTELIYASYRKKKTSLKWKMYQRYQRLGSTQLLHGILLIASEYSNHLLNICIFTH